MNSRFPRGNLEIYVTARVAEVCDPKEHGDPSKRSNTLRQFRYRSTPTQWMDARSTIAKSRTIVTLRMTLIGKLRKLRICRYSCNAKIDHAQRITGVLKQIELNQFGFIQFCCFQLYPLSNRPSYRIKPSCHRKSRTVRDINRIGFTSPPRLGVLFRPAHSRTSRLYEGLKALRGFEITRLTRFTGRDET